MYINTEILMNLSHFILEKPEKGYVVDHINNNALDNRRENLRFATKAQNSQNTKKTKQITSSKYIGVCYNKRDNKWQSNSSGKNLGLFENEIDAAEMYDKYTFIKFGKFASTNNLIKYEDVKDLTLDDIKPQKVRELPMYIIRVKSGKFFIMQFMN